MPRPSKRLLLLDAASTVVVREGAASLTLDRVAAEAGVSKGGLLYHFPDRRSLLEALVHRFVERFERVIAHDDPVVWAERYVRATLSGAFVAESAALLVVLAEDRGLLAPLTESMTAVRRRLHAVSREPDASERAFLAADAVWYADLLGLPTLDDAARQRLTAQLLAELRTHLESP